MFSQLIERGRHLAARVNRYRGIHIKNIPAEDRLMTGDVDGWFASGAQLVTHAFGQPSDQMTRWNALQQQLHEKAARLIDAAPPGGDWGEDSHLMKSINKTIRLLTVFQNEYDASAIPTEIKHSLVAFQAEHPVPAKVAFVMMRFATTPAHTAIMTTLKDTLARVGITAVRADDKTYHDDLYWNILTYVYGCGLGVAVFEQIETEQFNPNVALEVGYMLALRKPVCLLKDRALPALHADLMGKLYTAFDAQEPASTIPEALAPWLRAKGWSPPRA